MNVRPHAAQHDRAEALPLVTESATVTAVRRLDRNRVDAVERAVIDRLERAGRGGVAEAVTRRDGEGVDWDRLATYVDADDLGTGLVSDLETLRDRYERPYPSLVSIEFDCPELSFVPGQYVTVRHDDVPRPYSVASPPSGGDVEICVGRVPGGDLSPSLCDAISVGDTVTLRGPNGDFVPREPSTSDVAFLATGTGVAPLKSMIEYTFQSGRDVHDGVERDVFLFLGAGYEDDLPYRDRFRSLAERQDNFHFVPTLTREGLLTDWDGETDYVQEVLLRYVADPPPGADLDPSLRPFLESDPVRDDATRIDPTDLDVYACGVNAMVHALVETAEGMGVDPARIDCEGYG